MIPVVDLFAGPGGLNEGFSSLRDNSGNQLFGSIMSVEMDRQAHETLRLRAYYRSILNDKGSAPFEYISFLEDPSDEARAALLAYAPDKWNEAGLIAVNETLEVGNDRHVQMAKERLAETGSADCILIGGPPCQAYSLVGRARRARDIEGLQSDVRQTLYKCYLRFIEELRPMIFVMENVKGILSARHNNQGIFARITNDMAELQYDVYSLVCANPKTPVDYLVKANEYGIPQARQRVVLLGVRRDIGVVPGLLTPVTNDLTVGEALADIPAIRSGFSRRSHGPTNNEWDTYVKNAAQRLLNSEEGSYLKESLSSVISSVLPNEMCFSAINSEEKNAYTQWYRGRLGESNVLTNHQSRTHLASDLDRYLFCAAFAQANGHPARLYDFPEYLIPNHVNAQGAKKGEEVKFCDRFRVQLANHCSTTITSHISKDGHYYIHPDPRQCRSLTVREAARLQSLPDDYYFEGSRTSQYQQVGNAVPPLLAQQIAAVVADCLGFEATPFVGGVSPRDTAIPAG